MYRHAVLVLESHVHVSWREQGQLRRAQRLSLRRLVEKFSNESPQAFLALVLDQFVDEHRISLSAWRHLKRWTAWRWRLVMLVLLR